VLPPAVVERIDWSTLRLQSGNFVDPPLRQWQTDILYSVRMQGREAFLYLLLEHQSSSDPLMPLRMLSYMVRIWERFLKDNPRARKVPAIVPVVMHHSDKGWSAPRAFRELIDLGSEELEHLGRYLPGFEFVLDDLTGKSEQELYGRAMTAATRLMRFCLKRAMYSGDLAAELPVIAGVMRELLKAPGGVAALEGILRYIMKVGTVSPDWLQGFLAQEVGPEAEEAYMTAAEQLTREAAERALEKGRAEGRAELVLKQLMLKFGALSEEQTQRVRRASVEQLDRWAERVLNARSLAEVFGER
jgi:hypothetical protein